MTQQPNPPKAVVAGALRGDDPAAFSEKGFYLTELRDRTIAIALGPGLGATTAELRTLGNVLAELAANRTRVVVVAARSASIAKILGAPVERVGGLDSLPARVWRALRPTSRVIVATGSSRFERSCAEVVARLGIQKLVWVDPAGGLLRGNGARDSFIDASELADRVARGSPDSARASLFAQIEGLLNGGVAAVNLCRIDGVADELFTYDGSGTLFTARGYVEVRQLGIDHFDAAADLIERGVSEGFLAPRSPADIERVLGSGFGAFVGGNHLAGIGTLLNYAAERAAEIASLYTLTRFVGEGIGGHLVRYAVDRAAANGCDYVFAITTSGRVEAFFERNSFRPVTTAEVPDEKWRDYDAQRRRVVICLRREI